MLTIDYTLHIGDEKLVRDTSPREFTMGSKHWLYHWYKREGSTTSWIRGLAVFIMLQSAFVFPPCSLYAMASNGIGTVNIAVRDVHRGTELEKLKKNDTVVLNETVSTGSQSAVRIELLDGSILSMGELSSIVLDSIVYNTNRGVVEGVFTLTSGFLNFKSAGVPMEFNINTPIFEIGIRGTKFDLLTNLEKAEVSVQEGIIDVISAAGIQSVFAGEVLSVDENGNISVDSDPSPQLKEAVKQMLSALDNTAYLIEPAVNSVQINQIDLQSLIHQVQEKDPSLDISSVFVMELERGLVLVESFPTVAPYNVRRVRDLAIMGSYDGATFDFVSPGYAAEIGVSSVISDDLAATPIPLEVSDLPFLRGTVGMSRSANNPDSGIGAFFITLGAVPSLEKTYTVWGRVIYGIEVLDGLASGRPPAKPDAIVRFQPLSILLNQ